MIALRSLYWRFAGVFIAVFALMAIAAVIGIDRSTRFYHQEATQRLHRDLAGWIVAHYGFDRTGGLGAAVIERVFADAMNVNPTIELYLLDTQGRIRAFSVPPDSVRVERIDMGPLRRYFEQPSRLPVLGDDPRHPGVRRVFSVAPIGPPDAMSGYLYAVIGGEHYQGLIERFRASHILRISFGLTLAALLAGVVWGLLSFAVLTRRLRRIARALQTFRSNGFSSVPHSLPSVRADGNGDELDRLSADLRTLMELILRQIGQLRESDGRLREMIASLSHDLRTPLTSLGCYLDTALLREAELSPEERRSHLTLAARHHARLSKLVDALFELAQLEFPGVRIELQPASIADLLLDVAQKFGLRAADLGISLQTSVPEDMPQVHADVGLLERTLENLIDNALRHTPRGGRIRIIAEAAGKEVRVMIEDNGVGIPAEHLKHIFDRFYRVDRSRRDRTAGAGLGLAIARRIIDLHGGRLAAQSEPGAGSVFTFTLRPITQPVHRVGRRSESEVTWLPQSS